MRDCDCVSSGELGIALSGGGARALAQIGVLKELDREGIPISYVAGTSAGAVIGAVYVTAGDAAETERRILELLRSGGVGFNMETFAGVAGAQGTGATGLLGKVRNIWRSAQPGGCVVGGAAIRESLHALLGDQTFADTRVPFATTALDLVSGRRMIFAGGPLVDAVYASAAIPGLFEPLELDGHVMVDGGWAEPVPVDTCHHLGAIHIIAIDVPYAAPYDVNAAAMSTAVRADALARNLLEDGQLRQADFVVRVNVAVRHFADFGDFGDPERLVAAGEEAAGAVLGDIRAVLERHHALFVRPRGQRGHLEHS